ncbi:Glucose dehydrogenase [Eumeta japonica]|uniref:Glucose dehydrogenase n=1 Tax=Eumeta variegata TaxID=151549 RepID=A0A4C1Z6T6_EUMVA|nr:Glucose dehydrogenase [Eumeta japonica]
MHRTAGSFDAMLAGGLHVFGAGDQAFGNSARSRTPAANSGNSISHPDTNFYDAARAPTHPKDLAPLRLPEIFSLEDPQLAGLGPVLDVKSVGDDDSLSIGKIEGKDFNANPDLKISTEDVVGKGGISESLFRTKGPESKFDFSFLRQTFSENPYKLRSFSDDFDDFAGDFFDIDAAATNRDEEIVVAKPEKEKKSRSRRQTREEYDFIIVGAGSAGCVLANRLSEVKKWKILLLEAGPEEPDVTSVPAFAPVLARSSIDWMYRTQPEQLTCRAQRGRTCAWLRGKVMGGCSSTNYLVYMRGNKKDYDGWAEMGNPGWTYAEVLPYFKKSENNRDVEKHDKYYHGIGGPLNVERFSYVDNNVVMLVDAFRETGLPLIDFNGPQQIGTMTVQTTSSDGMRASTNIAFIRPIRKKRPNLTIETQAEVTKVLINPKTKIAYGVRYIKNGKWYESYAKKEVILSAGSLNSAKILMLSGVGPIDHLRSLGIKVYSNLKVGYNLQDHVTTDGFIIAISNKTSTAVNSDQLFNEVNYYYKTRDKNSPLAATGPLHISAFIRTEFAPEDESVPDIQFHFDGRNLKEFYSDPTTYLATNIFPFSFYSSLAVRPILLSPKSRGFLKLNTTDPIFGQPLIYPRFFTKKIDVDTLVAAMRYAVSLEETESFKKYGASFVKVPLEACKKYAWGTYEYFFCLLASYTSTIFHPVGTCKMGPHWDKDAVVDPRLRVYGVKSLRVIDASIMPNIVRGNTNAPIIMIGEKGADLVKEDWLDRDCL